MLPNLLICGAPRSGTTSLFNWLRSHPEVTTSNIKETRFFYDRDQFPFNHENNFHDNNLVDYEAYFSNCFNYENIILEASSGYLYSKTALKEIPKFPTNPKIIFIFRNPVERIISSYKFMKHNMRMIDPKASFSDYINDIRSGDSFYNPIETSSYSKYLIKWLNVFEEGQVKVCIFDDLVNTSQSFMRDISEYLNIDCKFWDNYLFETHNSSINLSMHNVPGLSNQYDNNRDFSDETNEILISLYNEFKSEVQNLSAIINRDLYFWDIAYSKFTT